jgi:hypothetical protein
VTKKYDPLWEIIDEKVALQGQEPDVDLACPYCGVLLHVGATAVQGQKITCGLCSGSAEVVKSGAGLGLKAE